MISMYKINDKIMYDGKEYTVKSSILYLNENYIIANYTDSIDTLIMLKSENSTFKPVNFEDDPELYARLIVLFVGVE